MKKFYKYIFIYIVLSMVMPQKVHAWVGEGVATLKGTSTTYGTDLSEPTAYPLEWDTSEFDKDFYTHDPDGIYPERLYVDQTGDYLVSVTIPFASGGAQREQIQMEVYVNGSAADGTIGGSSYIRNASDHSEATNHVAAMVSGLSTGDYIEVYVYETGITSVVTVEDVASLYVEHIKSSRTVFSGTATQSNAGTTPTDLNQTTAFELEWTEVRKNSGFTHSNSTNPENITLDGSGHYLVFVNVPLYDSSGTDRQSVMVIPQIGGVTVPGGNAKQGYLRDNSTYNDYSSVHWSGVVYSSSNSQDLTVQVVRNSSAGTTTVPTGKTASIYVEKLDNSANNMIALRGTDLTGGTDWNPSTAQSVEWETNVIKDSAVFTHSVSTNPHRVEVEKAGDYLLSYNDSMGTSTVARIAPKSYIEVNGVPVSGAQAETHYIRGQTYNHYESSNSLVFLLEDLLPNDIITVQTEQEAASGTLADNQDALLFLWYKGHADAHTNQMAYRWRNNTTDLNTSGGWIANENTSYDNAARNSTYRLRLKVANNGDSAESSGRTYELQYGEMVTTCQDITAWTGVGDASDELNMSASTHIDPDGESITASLLTNSEGYTFINGQARDVADTTSSIGGLSAQNYTELEYSITPTSSASFGTAYCFRLYDTTAGSTLDNYDVYPQLTVRTPNISLLHYRWRDDSTDLNTSGGWLASEDSDPSTEITVGATYRLRANIANNGSLPEEEDHAFGLQYGKRDTTCAAIDNWIDLDGTSDDFDMAATIHIDPDGETISSGLLSNTEAYTFVSGAGHDETSTTAYLDPMANGEYRELEFSIQATAASSPGTTYCFRIVDDFGLLEEYNSYPTLTTEGGLKVQKIIGSITGTLSKVETIQDPVSSVENAFLFFDFSGASSADNTPQSATCTAYLSSTSEITVEKDSTTGSCVYAIYVVEALRNEFIVRGRGSINIGVSDLNGTGAANNLSDIVDINKVFVPGMSRSNGTTSARWFETFTTLELSDSTTVTAERGSSVSNVTEVTARYEVVEFMSSGVRIQTNETFLEALSTTDFDVTLDETIDTTRSFVYSTFRHASNGLAQIGVRNWIVDSETISFDRGSGASYDSYARWWVIEFPGGGASVQSGQNSQGSPNDTINVTLPSAIITGRSFPIVTHSNSGTGAAFPRGVYYSDIDGNESLTLYTGYSGNTEFYAWQVIDTSGFVADKYNFTQNDYLFLVPQDSVTLTNTWPPGSGENLLENQALVQFPATNRTLSSGDRIRLKMNTTITGSALSSSQVGFKLQFRESDDCTTHGYWTDVGAKSSGAIWRLYDESSISDSTVQVNNISTSDSSAEGYYSEINPTADNPNSVNINENSEWDWPLENNDASPNTTYCFRMVLDDNRILGSYRSDSFPKITTAPSNTDFMRHGKFFSEESLKGYFWAN